MSLRLWLTACSLDNIAEWMDSGDDEIFNQLLDSAAELFAEQEGELFEVEDDDDEAEYDDDDSLIEPDEDCQDEEGLADDEICTVTTIQQAIEEIMNGTLELVEGQETASVVCALYLFAKLDSRDIWPSGEAEREWAWADFDDLLNQLGERFGEDKKYLECIVAGRPIIGDDFTANAGFYSFLFLDEIVRLKTAMQKVHKECSKIIDSGAMNEQDFDSGMLNVLECHIEDLS